LWINLSGEVFVEDSDNTKILGIIPTTPVNLPQKTNILDERLEDKIHETDEIEAFIEIFEGCGIHYNPPKFKKDGRYYIPIYSGKPLTGRIEIGKAHAIQIRDLINKRIDSGEIKSLKEIYDQRSEIQDYAKGINAEVYYGEDFFERIKELIKSVFSKGYNEENDNLSPIITSFVMTTLEIKKKLIARLKGKPLTEENIRFLEKITEGGKWTDEEKGKEICGKTREWYNKQRVKFLGKKKE
jgi:hypothetical protein